MVAPLVDPEVAFVDRHVDYFVLRPRSAFGVRRLVLKVDRCFVRRGMPRKALYTFPS